MQMTEQFLDPEEQERQRKKFEREFLEENTRDDSTESALAERLQREHRKLMERAAGQRFKVTGR